MDFRACGINDVQDLPEKCLQQYERTMLWDVCSDVTKSVLEWTWGRLPEGGYQNWGWRGLLRIVATLPKKDISLS